MDRNYNYLQKGIYKMNEDYILHFKVSEQGVKLHNSYLTALSSEFSGVIKANLKKHKHLTGSMRF